MPTFKKLHLMCLLIVKEDFQSIITKIPQHTVDQLQAVLAALNDFGKYVYFKVS